MTAQMHQSTEPSFGADGVEAAREHIVAAAFTESRIGSVGLELELHLVDLADPIRRPTWDEVQALATGMPAMPSGSSVTLEPGGQIELSTPPQPDVVTSVAALQADRQVLRETLAAAGFGAAPLGTDPAREPRRINTSRRYVAMEQHFRARECLEPGLAMMTASAALQVNLDAGPRAGWRERLALMSNLGPVLVAVSAASPYLGGTSSGWHSMRQQTWHGIDHDRSDPVHSGRQLRDPAQAWADYALEAPVMLVRDGDDAAPVLERVTFQQWLQGESPIGRPPTSDDLDYHLTTLFPPVRPRGYLEIRCIDAAPDRWWPAVATFATVLLDDPVAADRAREITGRTVGAWTAAARDGLRDPDVGTAARECLAVALDRCPPAMKAELDAFAELIDSGRAPRDVLRERADDIGPLGLLAEEAVA